MSSNIEIEKTCLYCKSNFIAKTLTTKYCSHKCNQRDYKKRKREEKIESFKEEQSIKPKIFLSNTTDFKNREYLSITESALILTMSTRNIYRLISNETLKAYKVGGRTLIKKSDIDKLFVL